MPAIRTRLGRLEERRGGDDQRRTQIEADAAMVMVKLKALADGFSEQDRDADAAGQMNWSLAQRAAWSTRFCSSTGVAA